MVPSFSPCSHLCWRKLLQVPVQPERGVFQGRLRPVPGDDWWEDMTLWLPCRLTIRSLVFLFSEGGDVRWHIPPYLNRLCNRASKGGRKKREAAAQTEGISLHRKMECSLLFRHELSKIVSGQSADTTPKPNTRGRKRESYFFERKMYFLRCLPWNLQWMAIF